MSSAGAGSPGGESRFHEAHEYAPGAQPSADQRLLDVIIQETERLLLSAAQEQIAQGSVDAIDLAAVRAIARRRRGEACTLEPVVQEITSALLERTFRQHIETDEEWHALSARVAQTLYDDPAARQRIETMWQRMAGSGAA